VILKGAKIDRLSFEMCPLLAQLIIGFFSFFWLQPFTVLMKQTRAVKQSIFLDVCGLYRHNIKKIQINFKVQTKKSSYNSFSSKWIAMKKLIPM
jgi:hypothetical protein